MARNRRRKLQSQPPIELTVEKLSHEGRGIAHVDGKVVFVEEALAGEMVEARITSRRDSFSEAETLQVLKAAADRVTPPCGYASICGGCSLQHFNPPAQILFKQSVLHEKLGHAIRHDDYLHLEAITGPDTGYRKKARLAVRYVHKKEKVLVGFREKKSAFITDMQSCSVLDSQVSSLLVPLAELIQGLESMRSIPQIEVAVGDELAGYQRMALVFRHLEELGEADQDAIRAFAGRHGTALYLQPAGVDSVHRVYPDTGEDRLYYTLPDFDLTLAFHPMDFTQVNAGINRKMLQAAVALLELSPDDRVLDLFCGLGNFTLCMARHCRHVTGVEGVEQMVRRGYENADRNGITNVDFHAADLSRPMAGSKWLSGEYSRVLLDPPRSGALEILPDVVACKPEKIVYISCNPSTLARDAGELESMGYRLKAAGVLDMFPHTTHVESICLFEAV